MGLPVPPALRRTVRGVPLGRSATAAGVAGLLGYFAGLAVFGALTWSHLEENPTQSTYIVDMGKVQLGAQTHSAEVDSFWHSVALLMNTGRTADSDDADQIIPKEMLSDCQFFMQPATKLGAGKTAPADPSTVNITAELSNKGIESFIIATCVHKMSLGQAAGMSIGWFDKVTHLAFAVAGVLPYLYRSFRSARGLCHCSLTRRIDRVQHLSSAGRPPQILASRLSLAGTN